MDIDGTKRASYYRQLRMANVAHERAASMADEKYPATSSERDVRIREREEQAAITKLFREHGFTVRSTSQARASKISIGFYDLLVTHKTLPIAFFFDAKRQVGSVWSEAQQEFEADLKRCGWACYHGDRYEAQRVIDITIGAGSRGGGA